MRQASGRGGEVFLSKNVYAQPSFCELSKWKTVPFADGEGDGKMSKA